MAWINAECVVPYSLRNHEKRFQVKVKINEKGAVPEVPEVPEAIMVGDSLYLVLNYSPLTYKKCTFDTAIKLEETNE